MELGLYAESAGLSTLDETLEAIKGLGISRIELSTGGQCTSPFLQIDSLLSDSNARQSLVQQLDDAGLKLSALNVSQFLLHPTKGASQRALTEKTFQLAGLLGVERIVTQSGAPGDSTQSTLPNWVVYPWPDDMLDLIRRQWDEAIALWTELAEVGKSNGVTKFCFELHPMNLAYNVPTLLYLREAVGTSIGVNFDPSHLMWQGMDIPACVRALGPAIFHVHAKDVRVNRQNLGLTGVLDGRADVTVGERPWTFCTPGYGHDDIWWRDFFSALYDVGYDDVVSIENEDPYFPGIEGVRRSSRFLSGVL